MDNNIFLKREDLQPVFSFKIRGAYNKIASLSHDEAKRGVITASAGNHAQGVALSATKLGIPSTIVMPVTTPAIKVNSVRRLGGTAVLHGDTFDEAYKYALSLAAEHNLPFVHPYDDPDVIAGQGTVGMEILRQHTGPLHAVFVPVGGGGLISGVAAYIKYLRPETKIIGVEPVNAAALYHSLKAQKQVRLDRVDIFADGVAVKQLGDEPWRLAKHLVDEVIRVSSDEICAAVKDIFDDTRSIAEPAGALAVAGLKRYIEETGIKNQNMVAIVSGANVNFDRLRHISERAELGEERECLISLRLPETPGSLKKFCLNLGATSITEFNYRYVHSSEAFVFIGIGNLNGKAERFKAISRMRDCGYVVDDLTDNELAKLHIRHMVGGHVLHNIDELLYRFHFPERAGALMKFLSCMADTWNISLFHYRNDGASYGQVLVGFQIPPKDHALFRKFLDDVGYEYVDETNNSAYHDFLGNPLK